MPLPSEMRMARVPETVLEMAQRTLEAALVMVVIPLRVLGPAMQARAMLAEPETALALVVPAAAAAVEQASFSLN